jgi:mono/diheme cytochrome c family protein
MHSNFVRAFTIGALAVGAATMANAQQNARPGGQSFDRGKWEYAAHCAACHGLTGAGEGPYASYLNKPIPNLTTLSKRNGGVFPFTRVYEMIDGRQEIGAHGPKDMPIWGPRYNIEVAERLYDDYRADPEAFVRARILALTEYIYRLQAK